MKRIFLQSLMPILIAGLTGLSAQGHGGDCGDGNGGHGNGHGGGHGNGGYHATVDTVTTTGTAIVISDTGRCFIHTRYFLDTDGNDTIDLALKFGPENYEPESGAVRPAARLGSSDSARDTHGTGRGSVKSLQPWHHCRAADR